MILLTPFVLITSPLTILKKNVEIQVDKITEIKHLWTGPIKFINDIHPYFNVPSTGYSVPSELYL